MIRPRKLPLAALTSALLALGACQTAPVRPAPEVAQNGAARKPAAIPEGPLDTLIEQSVQQATFATGQGDEVAQAIVNGINEVAPGLNLAPIHDLSDARNFDPKTQALIIQALGKLPSFAERAGIDSESFNDIVARSAETIGTVPTPDSAPIDMAWGEPLPPQIQSEIATAPEAVRPSLTRVARHLLAVHNLPPEMAAHLIQDSAEISNATNEIFIRGCDQLQDPKSITMLRRIADDVASDVRTQGITSPTDLADVTTTEYAAETGHPRSDACELERSCGIFGPFMAVSCN